MTAGRVYLKPLGPEDAEQVVAWRNLPSVSNQMFADRGPTLEEHLRWFEGYRQRTDRREFMICLQESGEAVGTIGLSGIDPVQGRAEYGILIGSEKHRGLGLAQEASRLILAIGFGELRLHKIILRVFADNQRAIELYKRVGFVQEGYLREEHLKDGRYRDVVLMAAFAEPRS